MKKRCAEKEFFSVNKECSLWNCHTYAVFMFTPLHNRSFVTSVCIYSTFSLPIRAVTSTDSYRYFSGRSKDFYIIFYRKRLWESDSSKVTQKVDNEFRNQGALSTQEIHRRRISERTHV